MNVELEKLSYWFKVNKLSLNLKKTNLIMFGTKDYDKYTDVCDIIINQVKIEHVASVKFLRVVIDNKLTQGRINH